jgi:hypothetical protein
MKPTQDENYQAFLITVQDKIRGSQYEALKAVNQRLILLYWEIGKMIVEKQKEFGWGKSVVNNLSADINLYFGKLSGFSATNLWRMRFFYKSYPLFEKIPPVVGEISRRSRIFYSKLMVYASIL